MSIVDSSKVTNTTYLQFISITSVMSTLGYEVDVVDRVYRYNGHNRFLRGQAISINRANRIHNQVSVMQNTGVKLIGADTIFSEFTKEMIEAAARSRVVERTKIQFSRKHGFITQSHNVVLTSGEMI